MFLFQARNEISVRLARRLNHVETTVDSREDSNLKRGVSPRRVVERIERRRKGRRRGDAAVRRKEEGKETKREGRSHRGHSERQGIQEGTQQWVVGGRKMLGSHRARDRRGRMRKEDVGGQGRSDSCESKPRNRFSSQFHGISLVDGFFSRFNKISTYIGW